MVTKQALPAADSASHAARAAGLEVRFAGTGDAADAVARAGAGRLLHLAGREHVSLPGVLAVPVYASEAVAIAPEQLREAAAGAVALLHSGRAATRFAALWGAASRESVRVAAISDAVRRAAGEGWGRSGAAPAPTDAALVALAASLAIDR